MNETTLLPKYIQPQELVYRDKHHSIYRVVAQFDGFTKEYHVSDWGQRAALLVVRDDEVLLVRQYRLLVNRLALEVPGGKVDEGETHEAAAQRECREETGVQCLSLKPLVSYHPSLDMWRNHTHIYYSEDFSEMVDDNPHRRVWIPLERCIEMIFSQEISDSLTIVALLSYQAMLSRRS
jgi:8-oxo-dGTP pyrophosphatase MutT (NUDIX family)